MFFIISLWFRLLVESYTSETVTEVEESMFSPSWAIRLQSSNEFDPNLSCGWSWMRLVEISWIQRSNSCIFVLWTSELFPVFKSSESNRALSLSCILRARSLWASGCLTAVCPPILSYYSFIIILPPEARRVMGVKLPSHSCGTPSYPELKNLFYTVKLDATTDWLIDWFTQWHKWLDTSQCRQTFTNLMVE